MAEVRVGLIGAGYMGKAHTIALQSVGAIFETGLRPVCDMIATSTEAGAAEHAARWGWKRSTGSWRALVDDPDIDAVIIATPPRTHLEMVLACVAAGKPVLCEKPLGCDPVESLRMVEAIEKAGLANMVGFNYIRTPASQLAKQIIASGEIGEVIQVTAEHVEDYLHDAALPASWRTRIATGTEAGALADVAPHIINACLRLVGPISSLVADTQIIHATRPGPAGTETIENDDQGQMLLRFANGASGSLSFSRVAAASSRTCSTLVALAIGAVTPGRAISQASATCAGVARCAAAIVSSAASTRSPCALRYFCTAPPRALLFARSASLRYLPLRTPLASA